MDYDGFRYCHPDEVTTTFRGPVLEQARARIGELR